MASDAFSHHPDYGRLTAYLQNIPEERVTLTLSQIESEVILGTLPYWARINRGWWSNTPRSRAPQNAAWLSAGWRVISIDPLAGVVTFERDANVPDSTQAHAAG